MIWQDGASSFVEAGGRLEYACYGPPPSEAQTLVLLHEGLGCVALWRDVPRRLARMTGQGVLVYSRAGYGASDPADLPRPLNYMTREALDVLPLVLEAFAVRRALLVGHSDGATIAAIYAGSVQDHRVRGMVLIAPHVFAEEIGLAEIARVRDAFATGDLAARMAKYHSDPEATFRGWNDAWLDPGFRDWDVSDVIDYIRVPVMAVQGTADPYGSMAQIDAFASRLYAPFEALTPEGAGHSPHLDVPDLVLPAIADFALRLDRIEREKVAAA